jgi:hypothetical protein
VEVIRCPYSGNLSSSCAIVSASPVNASSSALGDDEKPYTTLARHQERRSRPVRCAGQVVLSQCAPVPFYWGHGRSLSLRRSLPSYIVSRAIVEFIKQHALTFTVYILAIGALRAPACRPIPLLGCCSDPPPIPHRFLCQFHGSNGVSPGPRHVEDFYRRLEISPAMDESSEAMVGHRCCIRIREPTNLFPRY